MTLPQSIWLYTKSWSHRHERRNEQRFAWNSLRFATQFSEKHFETTFDPRAKVATPEPFADMWASIFAWLIKIGRLTDPTVLRDALKCCDAILHDQGYQVQTLVRDVLPANNSCVAMLIPGCQDEVLLKQRAVAGAEFYWRLAEIRDVKTMCLLSGSKPSGRKRVSLGNESQKLRKFFIEHLAYREGKHPDDLRLQVALVDSNVSLDGDSKSTEANVRRFVQQIVTMDQKPSMVVAASSTFHLIRLAEVLEDQLAPVVAADKLGQDVQLVLVGAETDEHIDDRLKSPIVWSEAHVKRVFFEVFNYFAKNGVLPPYGE